MSDAQIEQRDHTAVHWVIAQNQITYRLPVTWARRPTCLDSFSLSKMVTYASRLNHEASSCVMWCGLVLRTPDLTCSFLPADCDYIASMAYRGGGRTAIKKGPRRGSREPWGSLGSEQEVTSADSTLRESDFKWRGRNAGNAAWHSRLAPETTTAHRSEPQTTIAIYTT